MGPHWWEYHCWLILLGRFSSSWLNLSRSKTVLEHKLSQNLSNMTTLILWFMCEHVPPINCFACSLWGYIFPPISGSPSLRVTDCWPPAPSTFIRSALPLHSFSFPIVLFYQWCLQSSSTWIFIWGSLSIWSPLWCSINISSILSQDYFPWFSHCTLLKTFEPLNYWMNWPQKQNLFWL